MADTTFSNGTVIQADWMNDVNDNIYGPTAPAGTLRAQLSSTTSASEGTYMLGQGDTLSYTPGPRVANYIRSYTTPLAYAGCPTDGTSDASTYLAAALASGKKEIIIPGGFTFCVSNVAWPTGVKIRGEGKLKKYGAVVQPILYLADEAADVLIEGITIDGNRSAFSTGNAVMAILGHLCQRVRVHHVNFENIIDVGVKLRNSSGLELIGGRFYNIGENGVEIKNYDIDVRTGLAYTGTIPPVQGGHKITKATFAKIDNGSGDGSGDGCGVLISSDALYPVKGSSVVDCDFHNVKRGIWLENNNAGGEAEDFLAANNRFRGDIAAYGGDVYQAIGFIGVRRAKAIDNSIINIGNMAVTLPADSCNGIVVSGVADEVELIDNTIIDNTGNANRMDYGIRVTSATNIKINGNRISGASASPMNIESATVSDIIAQENIGAQDQYSWGNTHSFSFRVQNIPGTATTALTPEGVAIGDETEIIAPMPMRLVGVAVKQSAVISTGTIEYRSYTNGVLRSNLTVANADFSASTATKVIGVTSGVTIAAGDRVRVDVVTNGFTPTTADAVVTLVFDTSYKE